MVCCKHRPQEEDTLHITWERLYRRQEEQVEIWTGAFFLVSWGRSEGGRVSSLDCLVSIISVTSGVEAVLTLWWLGQEVQKHLIRGWGCRHSVHWWVCIGEVHSDSSCCLSRNDLTWEGQPLQAPSSQSIKSRSLKSMIYRTRHKHRLGIRWHGWDFFACSVIVYNEDFPQAGLDSHYTGSKPELIPRPGTKPQWHSARAKPRPSQPTYRGTAACRGTFFVCVAVFCAFLWQ